MTGSMAATTLDFKNFKNLICFATRENTKRRSPRSTIYSTASRGVEARSTHRLEFLSVLRRGVRGRPIDPIDETGTPQSVVEFMLEQTGMTRGDLAALMGGRARVSEFFAGKRRLSIEQVKNLRDALGIPADLLIQ